MRVTTKGQATIPRRVGEILGIAPETDIDFQEESGRFFSITEKAWVLSIRHSLIFI